MQTIAGLIPVLPAVGLPTDGSRGRQRARQALRPPARQLGWRPAAAWSAACASSATQRTAAPLGDRPDDLRRTLTEFFDEDAFLSPHGLRAVSKRYENNPYTLAGVPGATIDYEPAESTTTMFGGNSNWRGPVWMPVNYLAIRQFVIYQRFFGDDFKLEYPTGSGQERTFGEIAQDLADRLVSIWLPGADGRRPVYGGIERLQADPAWRDNLLFYEYFHGDNGAGLGAMHQTGWTALVADLILDPPGSDHRGR